MTEFTKLRDANAARQVEWANGQDVSLLFRATELGGECGEVLNVCKKIERERAGWRGSRATVEDLADELADVVICADLLALTEGIDLEAAIARKFNATSAKVGLPQRLREPGGLSEDIIRDAKRYRRLQILGCAVMDTPQLDSGTVVRFTGLDEIVDADLKSVPTRGEAQPL